MSIGPKKFDRYLLPIYPMLGLLAGLGIWQAGIWIGGRLAGGSRVTSPRPDRGHRVASGRASWPLFAVPAAALLLQAAMLLPVVQYPLSYYSTLVGGGAAAARLLLVGWGEGLDRVGAWIDDQPRPLGEPTVATSYHRVLQAQLQGSAVPLEHVRMADFVVPYVNTLQRGDEAEVLAPYLASAAPEYAVRINGIEYARVYRGPHHPVTVEHGIDFANRALLVRSAVAPGSSDVQPGEEVTVGLRWERPAGRERIEVAVRGLDGQVVVREVRPVGADGPNEQGQPGDLVRLTVPPRTPPGSYTLAIRVLDESGRSLPPVASASLPDGDAWVTLRDLTVSRAP
jgi:hypothetical protein